MPYSSTLEFTTYELIDSGITGECTVYFDWADGAHGVIDVFAVKCDELFWTRNDLPLSDESLKANLVQFINIIFEWAETSENVQNLLLENAVYNDGIGKPI